MEGEEAAAWFGGSVGWSGRRRRRKSRRREGVVDRTRAYVGWDALSHSSIMKHQNTHPPTGRVGQLSLIYSKLQKNTI